MTKHLLLPCLILGLESALAEPEVFVPVIAGEWTHIFDPNVKHKEPRGKWYTNDHTLIQTSDGRWHAYGIIGHRPARPWVGEDKLFHASADTWTRHDFISLCFSCLTLSAPLRKWL